MTEVICGVYTLEGKKGEHGVNIRPLGTVKLKEGEQIADTKITEYDVMTNVTGNVYACNITNEYVTRSKRLPMLYINIVWTKYLRSTLLCRLYLLFEIQTDVKSSDELLTQVLHGEFYTEIEINRKKKILDIKGIEKFLGKDEVIKKLSDFTQTEGIKEILKSLINIEEQKLAEIHVGELAQYKIPKNTISLKDIDTSDY